MIKKIFKTAVLALFLTSAIVGVAACSSEKQLTEGEQEYVSLSQKEKETLNKQQQEAVLKARKDNLEKMTDEERALLPTKEQKEAKKKELSKTAEKLAKDVN